MPIHDRIADYYTSDARHFLKRFSFLPPEEFDKAGRVKNFVDVIMAAECALKAHVFRGPAGAALAPEVLYRDIRRIGHSIADLAARADFMADRSLYDAVGARFDGLLVSLRYSLDMWETYFPGLFSARHDGPDRYDQTLGSTPWRQHAIAEVEALVDALRREPQVITDDIEGLFAREQEMADFARRIRLGQ